MFLYVGKEARLRALVVDQLADTCSHLTGTGKHESLVVEVGLVRQIASKTLPEQLLTILAVAEANASSAVIGRGVTEHIEEQTIDSITLQGLGQNDQSLPAIVTTV